MVKFCLFCLKLLACPNFHCDNGLCVSNSSMCNGVNECGDGSDEKGCGKIDVLAECTSLQEKKWLYAFEVFTIVHKIESSIHIETV